MGSRLNRWFAGAVAVCIVGVMAGVLARAQDNNEAPAAAPPANADESPTPVAPATAGGPTTPAAPPSNASATPTATANSVGNSTAGDNAATANAAPEAEAKTPVEPPKVLRSPVAILQALDKVTAETMRFSAPVGREVRYKSLVFIVKACETRDIDSAQPQASAYVVITSAPQLAPGGGAPPIKQVFRGWMFAQAPGLNALEHPIYDAWLIACSASAPTN